MGSDLASIAHATWYVFSHGGWIAFVLLIIWVLYQAYLNEVQTQYAESIEWTFLEVKPPRENITSFYSAEQMFIQLHQFFDNFSLQEKLVEGRSVFALSFEIVSLGGKISYLLRVPTKHVDLVESAMYANFPSLEINEVHDYLANFNYDPDDETYDMFGAEFILLQDESIPIRTYKEFQSLKGPEVSEIVVDPLTPLFEAFTRLSPHEFYGLQFVLKPVMDSSWKEKAEEQIKKLQGEVDYMQLDDITKLRISAIRGKLGKPAYQTKIRIMHLGKKEEFNKNAKRLLLSPFKIFGSANFNGLRPAFSPKLDWRVSPVLEAPYINWFVRKRKIEVFKAYKSRSSWIGEPMYILNTEELATLFHFPVTTATSQPIAAIETLDMRKIQPPANLPIEE